MTGERRWDADELLQILSHELRGALSPVRAWARILAEGRAPSGQMRDIGGAIDRSADVLARLADDIALLASRRALELPVDLCRVDLCDVVSTAVQIMGAAAGARGVNLAAELPGLEVGVMADRDRLSEIVWNLVDNAVKFTDRNGKVVVRVTADRSHASLAVEDTGRGIAAEFLPRVFDRFTRETSGDGTPPGRGLGLHVAKRLVELHGGRIDVVSPGPGGGSRFVVTLSRAA